jgi:hypothetical protein
MVIEIVKAISNKRFVSRKQEDYHSLSWLTKRIWLKEEIDVPCDRSIIYSFCFKNGLTIEGKVFGKGFDKTGFYIVVNMHSFNMDNDIFDLQNVRIPRGKAELNEVFNPHKDEEFRKLLNTDYMGTYFFHDSLMNFKCIDAGLRLDFKLGALGDNALHIELSGITQEVYQTEDINDINAFTGGKINEVYFRKNDAGEYVIKIDNSYKDFIYPDGHNCFSEPVKPKIIRHNNKGVIKCKKIEIRKFNYFIENLKAKGIECIQLNNGSGATEAETLRMRWQDAFLDGVNTKDIYIEQYLWHVFSYKRLIASDREEAQGCLNRERSSALYVFFNSEDTCYRLESAESFTSDMVECYLDVYITDERFTWTYVRTHETGCCGPYFYKKPQLPFVEY